jgi:homoserine dehydrogenase
VEPVKVGLLGLGTVGGGTVTVLTRNGDEIARRAGRDIVVSHAAAKAFRREAIEGIDRIPRISDDAWQVVADPEVAIVIELIGGYTPARELVLAAIENGKHVVTANKALIATHGNEIFAAAQRKGVMVAFEAAVAGGVPIIKALREGLAANRIEWIAGIINGTSNYILTQMRDHGRSFEDALAEAQALGYAEADPTFDIEGVDAAHKLTILGSLAFGIPLQFDKTYVEGITSVSAADGASARAMNAGVKLLAICERTTGPDGDGVSVRVHPAMVPAEHPLAAVRESSS